jgi:hypothetical protein
MDDFDIEMGDAADVAMEEAEIADIIVGDDQQVCQYRIPRRLDWPNLTKLATRRTAKSRRLSTTKR